MEMVGYEGLFGFLFQIMIIMMARYIPCPEIFQNGCVKIDNEYYF